MKRISLLPPYLFALCVLGSSATSAQQIAPAFETASIRPAQPAPGCYSALPPGGTQFATTCLRLRDFIGLAWKMNGNDLESPDEHALNKMYDVRATTADGQLWTYDSVRPMLRQLLTERFHLVSHAGVKQVAGFALVVARGGSKLKPSKLDVAQQGQSKGAAFQNFYMAGWVQGRGTDLAGIASLLSLPAHAKVVDRTGLPGTFDLDLHFDPDGSTDAGLPDFFAAVPEQLGLKLQPEKLSIPTLVLDHVDSEPTAN